MNFSNFITYVYHFCLPGTCPENGFKFLSIPELEWSGTDPGLGWGETSCVLPHKKDHPTFKRCFIERKESNNKQTSLTNTIYKLVVTFLYMCSRRDIKILSIQCTYHYDDNLITHAVQVINQWILFAGMHDVVTHPNIIQLLMIWSKVFSSLEWMVASLHHVSKVHNRIRFYIPNRSLYMIHDLQINDDFFSQLDL